MLETQLANLADEVVYNSHDIDGDLRSGLITLEQLEDVLLWVIHRREAEAAFPNVSGRRLINETIHRIINALIIDLIGTTHVGIAEAAPQYIDDVRVVSALVMSSAAMHEEACVLKCFLLDNLYRYYPAMYMSAKVYRIIDDLFRALMDDPRLLPPQYQAKANPDEQPRWIAHYIVGMTDHYVIKEYRRTFAVDAV